MKRRLISCLLLFFGAPALAAQHHLLIITGIGGTESYRQQFDRASSLLAQSALQAGINKDDIILLSAQPATDAPTTQRVSDKTTINQALIEINAKAAADDRIFVVLIGHGNPRGDSAVFNLPGPDISAEELAAAIDILGERSVIVINTASASGPFIKPLSRNNRVVITATSSGREYHAARFGEFFVAAFAAPGADRDKDERISMLEAFNYARREVQREFESEKRLLTEHALLDDSGDGEGSLDPGEFKADGTLAHRIYLQQPRSRASGSSGELIEMLQRKQDIEHSIGDLKLRRDTMKPTLYYAELEQLLVELALLARDIRAQGG